MTQTDILFFHNFWIFLLWDHFFLEKNWGKGGGKDPPLGGGEGIKIASLSLILSANPTS